MAVLTNTEVSQNVLVAVEITEGTAPASSWYRIPDLEFTPSWEASGQEFFGSTFKYASIFQLGKEWVAIRVRGPVGFGSQVFFLASAANYAAPVNGTPVTGKVWTFTPDIDGVNTSKSLNIQGGQTANKWQVGGCHVVDYSYDFNRDGATFECTLIGKRQTVGVTEETIDATVENVPLSPAAINCYSCATFGATPTQLDHVYAVRYNWSNLYNQEWPLKSTLTSWGDRYETRPTATMEVTALEQITSNDYTGQPFSMADMRAGTLNFFRLQCLGSQIGAGPDTYKFQIDTANLINGPVAKSFMDGLSVVTIPTLIASDPTSSKAYEQIIENTQVDFVSVA